MLRKTTMKIVKAITILLATSIHLIAASVAEDKNNYNEIKIASDCEWYKSNVRVLKGERFIIRKTAGGWTVDKKLYGKVGIAGHLDESITGLKNHFNLKYCEDAKFGQLLMYIADDERIIPVENGVITAYRGGYIFFRINDTTTEDNDGELSVLIEKKN